MATVRRGKEWERQMLGVDGSGVHYGSEEGWLRAAGKTQESLGDFPLEHIIGMGREKYCMSHSFWSHSSDSS